MKMFIDRKVSQKCPCKYFCLIFAYCMLVIRCFLFPIHTKKQLNFTFIEQHALLLPTEYNFDPKKFSKKIFHKQTNFSRFFQNFPFYTYITTELFLFIYYLPLLYTFPRILRNFQERFCSLDFILE